MDKTQKEKIREKFHTFSIVMANDVEEGKMEYEEVEGFICEWWFSQIDLAIKETEERLVRDIEEYEKTADEHVEPNEVYICCQDILALIRNK